MDMSIAWNLHIGFSLHYSKSFHKKVKQEYINISINQTIKQETDNE